MYWQLRVFDRLVPLVLSNDLVPRSSAYRYHPNPKYLGMGSPTVHISWGVMNPYCVRSTSRVERTEVEVHGGGTRSNICGLLTPADPQAQGWMVIAPGSRAVEMNCYS